MTRIVRNGPHVRPNTGVHGLTRVLRVEVDFLPFPFAFGVAVRGLFTEVTERSSISESLCAVFVSFGIYRVLVRSVCAKGSNTLKRLARDARDSARLVAALPFETSRLFG